MTVMSCERIAPANLPAVMCLDAAGVTLFATAAGDKLCVLWNAGLESGADIELPGGIGSLLRAASNSGCDAQTGGVRVRHPSLPGLALTIQLGGSLALLTFVLDASAERTLQQLTPCERRVALLVAEGLRNDDIAQRLRRSRRTIECQLNAIFRKLDLTHRTQLVRVLV